MASPARFSLSSSRARRPSASSRVVRSSEMAARSASASTRRKVRPGQRARRIDRSHHERAERAAELAPHRTGRERRGSERRPGRVAPWAPSSAPRSRPSARARPATPRRAAGGAAGRRRAAASQATSASPARRRRTSPRPAVAAVLYGRNATAETGSTVRTCCTRRASVRSRQGAPAAQRRSAEPCSAGSCGKPPLSYQNRSARAVSPAPPRATAPVSDQQPRDADRDRGDHRVVHVVEAVLPATPSCRRPPCR